MKNCVSELYDRFNGKMNDTVGDLTDNQIHYALNEAQEIYFERLVEDSDNDIRQLRKSITIKPTSCTTEYCEFDYPEDFYKRLNITLITEKCGKKRELKVHICQNDDIAYLKEDPFFKPSYEWRETLATISSNGLKIYKSDFKIINITLEYYRKPCEIHFASCSKNNKEYKLKSGRVVKDDQFELCDKFQIRKISDLAVFLTKTDYSDPSNQTYLSKINL